jgi:hypothetical protein
MSTRKSRPASSFGPRVGRLGRKVRQAAAAPPKGEHWLAEAERLLNSVVAFGYRAVGSWVHGWLALFSRSPARYLLEKEAAGQVLSWASVLVATSALAGVLLPVAIGAGTLPEWAEALSGLSNAQNYLAHSLPILGLGLALCFLTWLACILVLKRSSVAGTRLLVSTYYALCAVTVLLASALDMLLKAAVKADVLPAGSEKVFLSVSWFSAGFTVVFFLLGAATVWAMGRVALCAARRARLRTAKLAWFSSLPVAGLSFFLPTLLGVGAFLVIAGAPVVAEYLNPNAFKDPLAAVSIAPLPVSCSTTDAPKETRTLDCLLAAETSGEGVAFVDLSRAALFASLEPLGEWQQERYRFRRENKVSRFGADKHVEHSFLAEYIPRIGEVAPVNPSHRVADKVAVEFGKPLAWMLRFKLAAACEDEKLKKLMHSLDDYGLLYVRIETLRSSPPLKKPAADELSVPPPERFDAIGPWELPQSAFYSACTNLHR